MNDVMIKSYRPEKLNNHIKPNILRLMLTNFNHAVVLNDDIKKFDQLKKIEDINDGLIKHLRDKFNIKVSDKFYINNKKNDITIKTIIIKELNDIIGIVKYLKDKKNHSFKCTYNDIFENLLVDIYYNSYCP